MNWYSPLLGRCPGWSESSLGTSHFVGFVMRWLILRPCMSTIQASPVLESERADITWAGARQNQQNGMCTQRRLRSALAFAHTDQFLYWLHEEVLGPKLAITAQWRLWSDWVDAQADLSLCWAHRSFWWFCRDPAHMPNIKSLSVYFSESDFFGCLEMWRLCNPNFPLSYAYLQSEWEIFIIISIA